MEPILQHFHHALPWATLACAGGWSLVHHRVAEKVIRRVVPKSTYELLRSARRSDDALDYMCGINATALLHALVVVPLAGVALVAWPAVRRDLAGGHTPLFPVLVTLMSGYFFWDVQVCLKRVRTYGFAFLLHGVVSFAAIYTIAQADPTARFEYYALLFMLTELSTPLLHIRWFLLKARATNSRYFRAINAAFIATFSVVRLFSTEAFCFYPFLKQMFRGPQSHKFTLVQKLVYCAVIVLWLVLNIYWGLLLLSSQLLARKGGRRGRAHEQSKVPARLARQVSRLGSSDAFTELVQPEEWIEETAAGGAAATTTTTNN